MKNNRMTILQNLLCIALMLPWFGCVSVTKAARTSTLTSLDASERHTRFLQPGGEHRNVIYLMTVLDAKNGRSPYDIEPRERMDLAHLIAHSNILSMTLDEAKLFELLLYVEKNIRSMMTKKPNLMRAVIYVGQTKHLLMRSQQHRRDLFDEAKRLQSAKVRWLHAVLEHHFVRMDYLIENIPKPHLDVFESLVGHLFSVLEFKGSSQIGTKASYAILKKYFSSATRITTLKRMQLLDSMEHDRERLREIILPFQNPWSWHFTRTLKEFS